MGWVGASRLIGLESSAGLLRQMLANSATGEFGWTLTNIGEGDGKVAGMGCAWKGEH